MGSLAMTWTQPNAASVLVSQLIHVALVGDHDPTVTAHAAIPKALAIAASATGCLVQGEWVATRILPERTKSVLSGFDALWCVPASPYESMAGALEAIRFARETKLPFLGTCGGYQHAVLEYTRNALGYAEADNAEVNPDAEMALIGPLSCALVEKIGTIEFIENSYIRGLYGNAAVTESYHCSYGVGPQYLSIFEGSDLLVSGIDSQGEPRAVELKSHPFFIGTAYQPERSALRGERHPLISAFVQAAAGRLALCA